jgi:hypothetical protein
MVSFLHDLDHQYWQLICRAGQRCLVFCQVGRYVEFRGPQRLLAERTLGFGRAYLPRAGYAFAAGFPVWLAGHFASRAIARGLTVVHVPERPDPGCGRCTPRLPATVLIPAAERPSPADST